MDTKQLSIIGAMGLAGIAALAEEAFPNEPVKESVSGLADVYMTNINHQVDSSVYDLLNSYRLEQGSAFAMLGLKAQEIESLASKIRDELEASREALHLAELTLAKVESIAIQIGKIENSVQLSRSGLLTIAKDIDRLEKGLNKLDSILEENSELLSDSEEILGGMLRSIYKDYLSFTENLLVESMNDMPYVTESDQKFFVSQFYVLEFADTAVLLNASKAEQVRFKEQMKKLHKETCSIYPDDPGADKIVDTGTILRQLAKRPTGPTISEPGEIPPHPIMYDPLCKNFKEQQDFKDLIHDLLDEVIKDPGAILSKGWIALEMVKIIATTPLNPNNLDGQHTDPELYKRAIEYMKFSCEWNRRVDEAIKKAYSKDKKPTTHDDRGGATDRPYVSPSRVDKEMEREDPVSRPSDSDRRDHKPEPGPRPDPKPSRPDNDKPERKESPGCNDTCDLVG